MRFFGLTEGRLVLGIAVGVLLFSTSCDVADEPLEPATPPSRMILSQYFQQGSMSFSFAGRTTILPGHAFSVQYSHPDHPKYFDSDGKGKVSSEPEAATTTRYVVYWGITEKGNWENLLGVTNVPKMFSPSEPLGGIKPGRIYLSSRAYFYPNIQLPSGEYTITARLSDGASPKPTILDTAELDVFLAPTFRFGDDVYLLGRGMSYKTFSINLKMKELTATPLHLDPDNQKVASARLYLSPASFTVNQDFAAFGHFSLSDPGYTIVSIRAVIENFTGNTPPLRKPQIYPLGRGTAVDPPQTSVDHMVEYQPHNDKEITRVTLEVLDRYGQKGKIYLLLGL